MTSSSSKRSDTTEPIVDLKWLDESQTILLITYNREGWTWEDLNQAVITQSKMIASVNHEVGVIVDVNNTHMLPRGGSMMTGIRKVKQADSHQGHTVIVGASGGLAIVASNVLKIMGNRQKFHFADSLDEAIALLKKVHV